MKTKLGTTIEFSWDDAHVLDLKMAKLMKKYGLESCTTFYIPSINLHGPSSLQLREVKTLFDLGFIIGGHTMSHKMDLKLLEDKELEMEIHNNKMMLESLITGKKIHKFCPPRGRWDQRVADCVKKNGFNELRTTIVGNTDLPVDANLKIVDTSVHVFRDRKEYGDIPWLEYAKRKFVEAESKGNAGYFHAWGHSKEVDAGQLWDEFEELLKFIQPTL